VLQKGQKMSGILLLHTNICCWIRPCYILDKHILHFKMKLLQNDPRVISSERIFTISNQNLSYIKKMATQNTPDHQQHLEAELFKIV
jgi:hypothetical protein